MNVRRAGGWNLVEVVTLAAALALLAAGLYTLFHHHGFGGGLKWLGLVLLLVVPLMAGLIWKNERDNRRLRERLQARRDEKPGE